MFQVIQRGWHQKVQSLYFLSKYFLSVPNFNMPNLTLSSRGEQNLLPAPKIEVPEENSDRFFSSFIDFVCQIVPIPMPIRSLSKTLSNIYILIFGPKSRQLLAIKKIIRDP